MSDVYARRRRVTRRRLSVFGALTASVTACSLLGTSPAQASPPSTIAVSTAHTYLSELSVQAEGSMSGYDRDKFPHWITQSGNCDTREEVLKRDGSGVSTGSDCRPTSGSWYSEYDGKTVSSSSDVDIDHIVPLAEAWASGASSWTNDQRKAFANDLTHPQLIAVSSSTNRSKSDKDPAEWLPPRAAYHCLYARMWIHIKHLYKLSVDPTEKSALQGVLNGSC